MVAASTLAGRVVASRASTIAAASSLRHVLPRLVRGAGPVASIVRPVFGSSGNLYRQIAQGAPFGLFLAANADYAERLVQAGLAHGPTVSWATGRLALVVRRGAEVALDGRAEALAEAVHNGARPSVALANPTHAPYGTLAMAVLRHHGIDETLAGRLRIGENAAQAAQFALAGGVDVAIVPLSLARLPALASRTRHVAIDPALHPVLDHRMVLMTHATPPEQALFAYLRSAPALAALAGAGFGAPLAS